METIQFTFAILIFAIIMASITGCAEQKQKTWEDYRQEIIRYQDEHQKN
jgi:hypothetical protein